MRICNHCGGEVVERYMDGEGWSICRDCNVIEGGDHYEEEGA